VAHVPAGRMRSAAGMYAAVGGGERHVEEPGRWACACPPASLELVELASRPAEWDLVVNVKTHWSAALW